MYGLNSFKTEVIYNLFKLYSDIPYIKYEKENVIYEHYKLPFYFFQFKYELVVKMDINNKITRNEFLYDKNILLMEIQVTRHDKKI